MIDLKRVKEVFTEVANKYDDSEDMIQEFRMRESSNDISQDEYGYIISNWDKLLVECGFVEDF